MTTSRGRGAIPVMQKYKVAAPIRFIALASLLGPLIGLVLVVVLLAVVYALNIPPPTHGLRQVSVLAANAESMTARFAPPATLFLGIIPALVSAILIAVAAHRRPISFIEVLVVTIVVALMDVVFLGPSYLLDTAWIVLVPVIPAAVAVWLIARRAGLIARFP